MLRSPAFKRSFSRKAIHLFNIVNIISRQEQSIILYIFIIVFIVTLELTSLNIGVVVSRYRLVLKGINSYI